MDRKGQLSFDFYVAIILFIGILTYIGYQLLLIAPANSAKLQEESIRIDAYQLSELLVNDPGHPADWETKPIDQINRIGLSDPASGKTNYLSLQKLAALNAICQAPTGYDTLKNKLDEKNELSVTFINHSLPLDTSWTCSSASPTNKKVSFRVGRTVSIGGSVFGELIVEVWKQ